MLPLRDSEPAGKFAFWTILIIAINIFAFYLEVTSLNIEAFITQFALIPSLVDFNNLETLKPFITSQFLHAGLLHIGSNMLFLWIFGDNVEARFGFFVFPFVYLLSGAVGAFLQYILMPQSTMPMLGASGAVAGVLGAYFVFFPHHKVKTLIPVFGFPAVVDIPASIMLFYWFFTQLFAGFASVTVTSAEVGGVAFFAHIGGFTTGWLFAKLFG